MGDPRITIDTHALIWYLDKLSKAKLSSLALETIREAEKNGIIYVPTIALLEVYRLIEKGRFFISFDNLLSDIESAQNYQIIPFDTNLLRVAIPLKGLELHDRLILATAIMTDSTLVSKDRAMKVRSFGIAVVW
jgi:PIN domain nuclease of toxin-antitoxin system